MPEREYSGEKPAKKPTKEPFRDALVRRLTGRSAGFADKLAAKPAKEQAAWLAKQHKGSEAEAAKSAGVTLRTFRNWLSGKSNPAKASKEKLDQATRAVMVPQGRRDRITKSTKGARKQGGWSGGPVSRGPGLRDTTPKGGALITATIRVSGDERPRTINLGGNMAEGRLDALVQAYEEGGEDALMEAMEDVIREFLGGFTGEFEITGDIDIRFDPLT